MPYFTWRTVLLPLQSVSYGSPRGESMFIKNGKPHDVMRVKQRVFQTLGFNGQDRRTLFAQKVCINMKVNNDKIHRTNVPHILVWFILNRAHIHNTVQAARLQTTLSDSFASNACLC